MILPRISRETRGAFVVLDSATAGLQFVTLTGEESRHAAAVTHRQFDSSEAERLHLGYGRTGAAAKLLLSTEHHHRTSHILRGTLAKQIGGPNIGLPKQAASADRRIPARVDRSAPIADSVLVKSRGPLGAEYPFGCRSCRPIEGLRAGRTDDEPISAVLVVT